MKNLLLLLSALLITVGCAKSEPASKCRPYSEAVKDGTIARRTTSVTLSDSITYELDYVRDQDYKDYPHFCFGFKELNDKDFRTALSTVTKKYDADNCSRFYMLAEGANICNKAILKKEQIKYLLVHYKDKDNYGWFDFVNLSNNKTESYRDSGYASVSIYFLMKRTGITEFPSTTEFRNIAFDFTNVKRLDRKDDPLYRLANP